MAKKKSEGQHDPEFTLTSHTRHQVTVNLFDRMVDFDYGAVSVLLNGIDLTVEYHGPNGKKVMKVKLAKADEAL